MEKSLKLFLNVLLCLLVFACKTKEEKIRAAHDFANGRLVYQGSTSAMNAFAYALELDSTHAETHRELSIPYLKRGIPHEWKPWFDKAVQHDPETWQPWRGYLYLWFYRDYKKAIADFNASDSLTSYIDYPQGHSVDFWRGIAYLGLKDYENSIAYWDKHINKEAKDSGEDWVELEAFLYRGIAHYESGNKQKALGNFNKVIQYFNRSADAKYYKARILKERQKHDEALALIDEAIIDFKQGFYNNRAYVETLRQIYMEDLTALKDSLAK